MNIDEAEKSIIDVINTLPEEVRAFLSEIRLDGIAEGKLASVKIRFKPCYSSVSGYISSDCVIKQRAALEARGQAFDNAYMSIADD